MLPKRAEHGTIEQLHATRRSSHRVQGTILTHTGYRAPRPVRFRKDHPMQRTTHRGTRGRVALAVTAMASATALLAACSSPAADAGDDADYTPPASDLEASLTYAFWDASQQAAIEA